MEEPVARKSYTPEEVSQMVGITPATIRRWLKTGELAGKKVGRSWFISQEEVNRRFGNEGDNHGQKLS